MMDNIIPIAIVLGIGLLAGIILTIASKLMAVEVNEAVVGMQAIVKCSGTLGNTSYVMEYEGLQSCAANKLFYRGRGACHNACLGYGDCTSVCGFDAIKVVDNVAHVDKSKCVGCGMCIAKCPQHIIKIMPASQKIFVRCSSTDPGGYTKSVCKAGCISCKKCEKVCPVGVIHLVRE